MHIHSSCRPFLVAALLAASCTPALGADAAGFGKPDCRIGPLDPVASGTVVSWSGACLDGYASGKGVLGWREEDGPYSIEATLVRGEVSGSARVATPRYTYTGTLKGRLPHGRGVYEFRSPATRYEGEIVEGRFHGKGERHGHEGSRHTGEWVAGRLNGPGEAVFATGGSYQGQWKDGKFHGQGRIVYAGSGHTYEGRFENGRVAGQAPAEAESARYVLKETKVGLRFGDDRVDAYLPVSAGWDELTPAQKNTMRNNYVALEAGDDPPFPAQGQQGLLDAVHRINVALGSPEGKLSVYVLVGKDGKGRSVATYGAPHPKLVRAVAEVFMAEHYKPARCRGEPCEMVYPVNFSFGIRE
jgi:hypothetical protein